MGRVYFPRSIMYDGGNINVLPPDRWTKMGIDFEYNRKLPVAGTIHLEPYKVQQDAKEAPIYSYETVDEGVVDIGFK